MFANLANLSSTTLSCRFTCEKEKETKFKVIALESSTMWPKELKHREAELRAFVIGTLGFLVKFKHIVIMDLLFFEKDNTIYS